MKRVVPEKMKERRVPAAGRERSRRLQQMSEKSELASKMKEKTKKTRCLRTGLKETTGQGLMVGVSLQRKSDQGGEHG